MLHPKIALIVALVTVAACGSPVEKGPKKASENNENNVANNVTPNNATPNNVTPNNVTPNNMTPNNGESCVGAAPASLNFGDVALGGQAEATVTIENCSATRALTLDDAATIAGFEVALPEVTQIPPETTFPLTVLFSPPGAGGHTGVITISTSAGAVTLNVQGNGVGGDEDCPSPVALGRADTSGGFTNTVATIPLKTVQLTAGESVAPSEIVRYEWTIASRPANSTTQLTPSADVSDPELFLDLAGFYEVDLRVFTAATPEGCPAARLTINAGAADPDAIHVQLVWDTPGDLDQTDSIGTDMDLHWLHPSGAWNIAPYDCYWDNPNADWGVDGIASVDIDDTDGAGPENINHTNAGPRAYRVGVNYYSPGTFGASNATLSIRRGGMLIVELSKELVERSDFWLVGSFDAATDTFTQNGTVTNGFP